MANNKKIKITEELIKLNPEVLKDAVIGEEVNSEGLVLPVPEKKSTKVEVEKETLEKILQTMEELQRTNKSLLEKDEKRTEEIEMLKNISDKGRLNKYELEKNGGNLIRTARISLWEGLPIVGWQTIKDEVGYRDGRLKVDQQIRIFLQEEGKKEPKVVDLEYLYWVQNTISQTGEVTNKMTDKSGEFWTVVLKDGKKVTVDIRFINAF